jgi:hypothetical protein
MQFETVSKMADWVRDNLFIHNTQIPEDILDLISDSTPEKISDEFITFGLIVYSMKEGQNSQSLVDKQKDETSMYIYKLFFSFALEKLRRMHIIEFEPFSIFINENIDTKPISIIGVQDFIDPELQGKTLPYKEFVKSFW